MGQSMYDDTGDAGSAGDYIWLRYATRFSVGAREYTLEMGVPMPIGASEDEREQLLREADAGMNQLAGFVENKVALMLQRVQPNQGPLPTPKPSERPSGPFSPAPTHPPIPPASSPAPRAARPASVPAAQTAAQPMQPAHSPGQTTNRDVRDARDARDARELREVREVREVREAPAQYVAPQRDATMPPTRPTLGVTMPLAITSETGGNLTLPQFITIIRDTMSLNPKQAMEMLHVKSLNNVNLRDALEKLRTIIESGDGEANGASPTTTTSKPVPTPTGANQKTRETASSPKAEEKTPTIKPVQATPEAKPAQTAPPPTPTPARTGGNPALNIPGLTLGTSSLKSVPKEQRPTYTFDEEEEPPGDEDNLDDLLEDLDDAEEEEELTQQQRAQARALINQFRESRGPTVANAARLQVLHNVIIGQIDEGELLQLIQGIWNVNSVKKLKVDQAELLISWAKTDEFYDEVKAVLTVLEEEM